MYLKASNRFSFLSVQTENHLADIQYLLDLDYHCSSFVLKHYTFRSDLALLYKYNVI